MIEHLFGPVAGRRHDSYLLRESGLNSKLEGNDFQGKVYGDAAHAVLSHVDRGFRGVNLSPAQKAYNCVLSSVRVSVEWSFGLVVDLFPFVDFRKNLKLMLSPIGNYYTVSVILANAHTTLYGCETSLYFEMAPPSLEEYFQ